MKHKIYSRILIFEKQKEKRERHRDREAAKRRIYRKRRERLPVNLKRPTIDQAMTLGIYGRVTFNLGC